MRAQFDLEQMPTMNLGNTSTGFTVWFTGMSGSGKSTLSQGLANRLKRLGKTVDILDGAEVGQMLSIGGAQTKDERNAEARKLTWVCKLVTRGGGVIFQSAIESPYRETRDEARRQIGRFAEVFVECPIDTLIQRDRTGKYKRALAGELKNLVGISEPYEPPTHPEVIVDTSKHSVDEAVEHIMGQLVAQRMLDPTLAAMKSRPRVQARSTKVPAPKPVPAPKAAKGQTKAAAPAKPAAAAKPAKSAAPVAAKSAAPAAAKSAAPAAAKSVKLVAKPATAPAAAGAPAAKKPAAAKVAKAPAPASPKKQPAAARATEPRMAAGAKGRKR
jgi:adenylylsulfate kinase